jgi:Leucine-rich repeat (LRR) protein
VPPTTFSFDSTASRATNIVNYLNSVTLSGRRLVPDNAATSPVEERALYWMINADALSLVPDTSENQQRIAQRYALAVLWMAGGQWSTQQTTLHECEWDGVTCASASNALATEIDLSAIDDWNGSDGMSPDMALATALEHIDLSAKGLTGSVPESLGRLTNLVSFEVHQNDLTSTLPASIGQWTKLERFSVYDNALTGTIPGSIVQWTDIQSALFDSNNFSGSVPEGICQFRSVDLTLLSADCVVACNCCTYCA